MLMKLPKDIKISSILMNATLLCAGCSTIDNAPHIQPEPNADGKYNIIFITTDQESYMRTYPVGADFQARERLRRIGTTFEKHYACSNVSTSSRSVIYTGKHITQTHMMDNTNFTHQPDMSTDIKTVGDMMREAGYYTAYKGKWHISENNDSLEEYGFSDWGESGMFGKPLEGYREDVNIVKNACSWLDTKGDELNKKGQSFFLAVNLINPHDIMYFNEEQSGSLGQTTTAPEHPVYKTSYADPLPSTLNEALDKEGRPAAHREYMHSWFKSFGPNPSTQEGWKRFRDYYFNCIQDCDDQMKILLDYLESNDLMKNTIIVFTSDHGEMLGEHSLRGKAGNIYENNFHVPLVIYHPEHKGGQSCNHITSHLDLAPTFVDMALDDEKRIDAITDGIKGYSLMPAVEDPSVDVRNGKGVLFVFDMISMIDEDMVVTPVSSSVMDIRVDLEKRGYLRGIVTSDYKFARYFSPIHFNTPENIEQLYSNNDVELYKYGSDETENLAWPKGNNQDLVLEYNNKLNQLIKSEIGIDDGRETSMFRGGIMVYAK